MPKSLDVSTGSIVDSNGQQSDQIDIIVSDSAKTPVFYEREGLRVVPVECVYSAIEVKAKLTIAEIEKSFKNMKSVRRLEKKAYFSTTCHCTINTAIR